VLAPGGAQVWGRSAVITTFDRVFAEHRPKIYRYLRARMVGPELAEDLTQETFLRAWRHASTFLDHGPGPGPWLVSITRNLLFDHYKSGAVRFRDDSVTPPEFDSVSAPPDPKIRQVEELPAVGALLRGPLAALPKNQRDVLVLRYLYDLSVAEIAGEQGRTTGSVKSELGRAKAGLRRILTEEVWR
jgi:RNA polymerase sigma-70 factor, ECF subfamily